LALTELSISDFWKIKALIRKSFSTKLAILEVESCFLWFTGTALCSRLLRLKRLSPIGYVVRGEAGDKAAKKPDIIGFVFGYPLFWRQLWIGGLGVKQQYRGRGLGEALMRALLDSARARGYQRSLVDVDANNQIALKLYAKLGFQTRLTRRRYLVLQLFLAATHSSE